MSFKALLSIAVVASLALTITSPLLVSAQDPASSWLVYAVAKGGGKRVTFINATWTVPSYPTSRVDGAAPGFWFGIEPEPALDLIQPILAWGDGFPQFTIFNGRFNWNDGSWWQSQGITVVPGDVVTAYVRYKKSDSSYDMYIESKKSGQGVHSNVQTSGASEVFTDSYFVVEHQPSSCDQYPANGNVVFEDIHIELEGSVVEQPEWQIHQFQPACDSKGQVLSPTSVKFTWDTSGGSDDDGASN